MTKNGHQSLDYFKGRSVLVVEDEYFLADETRHAIISLGAIVLGPVARVEDAVALIRTERVDAAILDVQLDGEKVFPVAELLEDLSIPYVFATSYDPSVIPKHFRGFVFSSKAMDLEEIALALRSEHH